jgi:hypothetical protein
MRERDSRRSQVPFSEPSTVMPLSAPGAPSKNESTAIAGPIIRVVPVSTMANFWEGAGGMVLLVPPPCLMRERIGMVQKLWVLSIGTNAISPSYSEAFRPPRVNCPPGMIVSSPWPLHLERELSHIYFIERQGEVMAAGRGQGNQIRTP